MDTIGQRELRDDFASVMTALERGRSFMLTRNGVPVGEMRPYKGRRKVTAAELVEACRNLPPIDYEEMRAEADEHFGEDRLDDDPWQRTRGWPRTMSALLSRGGGRVRGRGATGPGRRPSR